MKLSGKQLGAIFEKMKAAKMNPNVQKVPTPHPKILTPPPKPMAAPAMPGMPGLPGSAKQANKVNPNYIGNPAHQRFKKIKGMFGI